MPNQQTCHTQLSPLANVRNNNGQTLVFITAHFEGLKTVDIAMSIPQQYTQIRPHKHNQHSILYIGYT